MTTATPLTGFDDIEEDEDYGEYPSVPDPYSTVYLPELPVPESDPSWREKSECLKHSNVDFHNGRLWHVSRPICLRCPVRSRCLDFAMENRIEHGMWGGYDPKERAAFRGGA